MIRGYANKGQADKSYIGAIAELLMHYPRQAAMKCADPIAGVARETKFLPTPADVIGFCEREQHPLHEEASREDRREEQLRLRDEWRDGAASPRLKEMGKAWLDRTDPIAAQMTRTDPETQRLRDENSARLVAQQREFVRRVWDDAGSQAPTIGGVPITPQLARKLGMGNA